MLDHKDKKLPTPANPILPLQLHPVLLAGVAIVEHEGSESLRIFRSYLFGEISTRFSEVGEDMIDQSNRSWPSVQLH